MDLVTSDAHQGLKEAIALCFSGASWQRCRTHFMVNLLSRVPKRANVAVAMVARTIYQQPTAEQAWQQHEQVRPGWGHLVYLDVVKGLR